MSKRLGLPKRSASARTIKRWLNPNNREIFDGNNIIPSANPNCTAGRNPERFENRKKRFAERPNG